MALRLVVALSLLALFAQPAHGWSDVILPPISGKQGTEVAMLFGQGADIPTAAYIPIMQTLQKTFPYPLWVGVPQCLANACAAPGTLSGGMSRITKAMQAKGMKTSTIFYGGHSLGGAMIPAYVNNTADPSTAVGLVLMGAFLDHSFKTAKTPAGRPQVQMSVPTLTIGGTLDGLCRVSRIAEALYSQITFSADPAGALKTLPVTVVKGMSHMQFASGTPPLLVKENDLRPEITYAAAHQAAASDASAFMVAVLEGSSSASWGTIKTRVAASTEFVQPLVDALLLEGYHNFLPPCYCETKDEYGKLEYGTCVSTPSCQGGNPWTMKTAQSMLAGVEVLPGLSVDVVDSLHKVTEMVPSVHLPHIHHSQYRAQENANANAGNGKSPPLCSKGEACDLKITTITQNVYTQGNDVDTGFFPIAATELRVKMKSRQAVWEAAGVPNVNFTDSDQIVALGGKQDLCREINQAALDWGLANAGSETLARYQRVGQTIEIIADNSTCAAGPCWIYDALHWNLQNDTNIVTVSSVAFSTPNKNEVPCGEDALPLPPCPAGFHYCKLLSPAQVMEWVYVDGLKNRYSIKNE